MIYTKAETICSVDTLNLGNTLIFYNHEGNLKIYENDISEENLLLSHTERYKSVFRHGETLVLEVLPTKWIQKILLYHVFSKVKEYLDEEVLVFLAGSEKGHILYWNVQDSNLNNYSLEDRRLAWTFISEVPKSAICSKDWYYLSEKHVFRYSLNTGREIWNITSDQFSPSKLLGVAHNHLFVLTKDNRIIVLNVDDGSLIKTFEWTERLEGARFFPNIQNTFLHPEDQNIYCLDNHILKINTETLEVDTLIDVVSNYPAMADVKIKNSSLQGDYISFVASNESSRLFSNMVGLFDYRSNEFVWLHDLQKDIAISHTPQLCQNRLYILDYENTLHIFERSEDT